MRLLMLFALVTLAVIGVIAVLFIGNFRQSQRDSIVLPDAAQSAQPAAQQPGEEPSLLEVSRSNVQSIVRYLHRPQYYHQSYTITRQMGGAASESTAELWVSDTRVCAVLTSAAGEKHLLTDGQTLYVWYASDEKVRQLPVAADVTMDELTGIPTYELLDTLPPETITDGEFITDDRYDSGRQIFAAAEQDGVRRECWISLDYGLLTESILKREDETVYDALQTWRSWPQATRPLTTSSSCRTARRRSNDRYNYVSDLRQEEGRGRQQNGQRILLLSIHGQKQQDQEHQQISRVDAARQQPRQEAAARILPDRQRRARRRRLRRGFWHRRRRRRLHRRRGRDVFHARGAVDARGVGDITVIHHGVSFGPGPRPRFLSAREARLASRAACSARSIFDCRSLRRNGLRARSKASCFLSAFPACRSMAAAGSGRETVSCTGGFGGCAGGGAGGGMGGTAASCGAAASG